jgi:hypothetical protein
MDESNKPVEPEQPEEQKPEPPKERYVPSFIRHDQTDWAFGRPRN